MSWTRELLVMATAGLFLLGCGPQDAPKHIWIDDNCSSFESEAIHRAIDSWNDAVWLRLDEPLIIFDGYFDSAGFDIDTDPGDDFSVVYCINDRETFDALTADVGSKRPAGRCLGSDVTVYTFKIADKKTGAIDPLRLGWAVTHELGHWLGLPHSNQKDSVMRPIMPKHVANFQPSDSDIDNICLIFDCVR